MVRHASSILQLRSLQACREGRGAGEVLFYPESDEEEEDDDQRLKLKEITQIVSVRDVDVETLGPVQQRNPIETDDLGSTPFVARLRTRKTPRASR